MKKVGGIGLLVVLLIQKCVSGSVDGGSFLHLLPDTTDSEYSWQYSSEHDIFSSANEANVLNYQPTESPLLSFTRKSVDTESLLRPVSAGVGRIFVRWNSSGLGGLQLRYCKYGRNPSDSAIRSILVPDVAEAYPISAVKCLVKVWLSNGMGLNSNAVVLGTVDVEANSSIKDPVLLKDRLLFKIDEKWKKDGSERFAGIIHDGEGRCASLLLINCRGCSEDLSVGSLLTDTYCYRALPLTNLVLDADVEELTATVRLPEQSALRIMSYRLTLGSFSSSYIKLSAPQQFRVRLQRVETPFAKFILSWRPPGRNGLLVKGFVIAVKMGHIEEFGQCKRFWMCEISQDKVLGNQLNDFLDEQSVFSSFCSKGEESQRKIIITPEALAKSMGNLDSDQTVEFDGLTDTFYSAAIAAYTRDGILSRSTVIEFTVPLGSPYSSGHLQGFLKRVKRENSQFSSSGTSVAASTSTSTALSEQSTTTNITSKLHLNRSTLIASLRFTYQDLPCFRHMLY
ncbi:unnamed protein product [Calicophoron daubneyi]|uniref:Uncharacterized protein n=1 Tax=Calicophoron daubneyi TaxID=300641 RepID=A0AAV2TWL2_CALDB